MVSPRDNFNWDQFREFMVFLVNRYQAKGRPLLDFWYQCDCLVGRIVNRPTSPSSGRPQDYVACILAVRAFRLTTGAVWLASSGYADLVANLTRTVWEIGMRLLDMHTDPVASSFGYLLQGVIEEIGTLEAELTHRQGTREPVGNLELNLNNLKSRRDDLCSIIKGHALDPEAVRAKHGKLNIRQICKQYGIEKAYLVNYAHASSYVHEKNVSTWHFMTDLTDERRFELGPVEDGALEAIVDALLELSLVLGLTSEILEDGALNRDPEKLTQDIRHTWDAMDVRMAGA